MISAVILVLSCITGIIPVIQVNVLAAFINTSISQFKGESNKNIFIYLFFILLTYFFLWFSQVLNDYLYTVLSVKVKTSTKLSLLSRCEELKLEDLETSDFYNLHNRIINNCEEIYQKVFSDVSLLISMVIRILGITFILFQYAWWVAIVIVLFIIPLVYFSFKQGKKNYEVSRDLSKQERLSNYYSEILTNRDAAIERTLFGFTDYINDKYTYQYECVRKTKLSVNLKNMVKMNIGTVISSLSGIITLIFLLNSVISNQLSIGLFISLVYATFDLSNILSDSLSSIANNFSNIKEYIHDINEYILPKHYHKLKGSINNSDFESLEFIDVSFKYPNSDRLILDHFSCLIEKNKHYAFVGLNGAGKTTFVKLALNLYHNYDGTILLNGKDIKLYSREAINKINAVVFQDYARYALSMHENIFLDTHKIYEDCFSILDCINIPQLIDKLPSGLQTNIGKIDENSIDLSGGEWQRLATARALIRDSSVIIFDEPTASMDPMMESQIYNEFLNLTENKTSIVISHRLGATRLYDIISVINEGRIVESGSHEHLMSLKGLYKEMYSNQRSWYQC